MDHGRVGPLSGAPPNGTDMIPNPLPTELLPAPLVFPGLSGPWEILIVLLIVLLLFGNKLPAMARNLGRSFIEFKKGVKGTHGGGKEEETGQISEDKKSHVTQDAGREETRSS